MSEQTIRYTVFTKPWRDASLEALADRVAELGFDGIELPVRDGFQVEPGSVARDLPRAARVFADRGLTIHSVAGPVDEPTVGACGEAGIPILRIMVPIPPDRDYFSHVVTEQRRWERLVPALERAGVTLGVQNHAKRFVTHAMHLWHALRPFNPRHVAAVWDAAHNALQGEDVELALDVIWPHLRLVNLKNGLWERTNPQATDEPAAWRVRWVTAKEGLCDWGRVAGELVRRRYAGPVCLTAEYADPSRADALIGTDLAEARRAFDLAAGRGAEAALASVQ